MDFESAMQTFAEAWMAEVTCVNTEMYSQWSYFSVRLWRHFVNFWVKIEVIKHMSS